MKFDSLYSAAEKLGTKVAKSQLFGCSNEHQGFVMAYSCLSRGVDIFSISEEYHVLKNKLTLQAHAMLARFVEAGGEYEIVAHSPKRAAIKLSLGNRSYLSELTWEDAQQEAFVYLAKDKSGKTLDRTALVEAISTRREELVLSQNYATPRRREQFMWARVVSDGVKVVAPQVLGGGVYTPVEMADEAGVLAPESIAVNQKLQEVAAESEAEAVGDSAKPEAQETGPAVASNAQVEQVQSLASQLGMDEAKLATACQRFGAASPETLSAENVAKLIEALSRKLAQLGKDLPSAADADAIATNGPMTQEQLAEVADSLKVLAQKEATSESTREAVRLLRSNRMDLKTMSYTDARRFLESVETAKVESFFDRELQQAG